MQNDFLHILARPLMFKHPSFQKPGYGTSQPVCDNCQRPTVEYFSSKATPNTDLCPRCFAMLKNDDIPLIVSGPTNVASHTPSFSPITSPTHFESTYRPATKLGARCMTNMTAQSHND